jgi:hypothetical protein
MNLKLPGTSHGRFQGWRMAIFEIWEVSLDGTPDYKYIHQLFLAIIFVASQLFIYLFLDKSMAWNRCLQHPCFKILCKIAQASKHSDSNAQHFLSDLLTHSRFSLHALCTPMLSNSLYCHEHVSLPYRRSKFILDEWEIRSYTIISSLPPPSPLVRRLRFHSIFYFFEGEGEDD